LSRGGLEKGKERGRKKTRERLKYQQKLRLMEPPTEIPKSTENHAQYVDMEIKLNIEHAIEFKLLRDDIRAAFKEFYEWYNWRYVMSVWVVLGTDYVEIYIEYDITQELESCENACIEQAKNDLAAEEYDDDDIAQGCYESCIEDIAMDINADFSEIKYKLLRILDKYGFKYDWEMSWDYNVKYLRVLIKF
jgi:hypothetical protein